MEEDAFKIPRLIKENYRDYRRGGEKEKTTLLAVCIEGSLKGLPSLATKNSCNCNIRQLHTVYTDRILFSTNSTNSQ